MKNQKIFITGATGFIGKHMALELSKENKVTALARGPRTDNKDKELLASGIKIIWGDLLDNKTYRGEIENSDYVFHLAALFKIGASKEESRKANVEGTNSLLESCSNAKLKRFVFFSTAYVSAGKEQRDGITESEPYSAHPRNWYEWSKIEAEKLALAYYKEKGVPLTIVRPATVYGPGSLYGWYLTFKAAKNKKVLLSDGGKNKIHFVSVHDVVKAALHLAEIEAAAGEIYNICDERPYSQKEAVTALLKAMKIKHTLFSLPKNLFKLSLMFPFISKFFYNATPKMLDFYSDNHTFNNKKLKDTGFTFKYPEFKDGIEETIRWYTENNLL